MNSPLPFGLTRRQASLVAFVSAFVTVIGGLLLALWFRRRNAWRLANQPVEEVVDLLAS